MPYVSQKSRKDLNASFDKLIIDNPGNLNYVISTLINSYIEHAGLSYSKVNEAIGVLECAKLELYRRIAAPYEESKINENGDVYTVQDRILKPNRNQVTYI